LANNSGYPVHGITSGFEVYSPDGAYWTLTRGDTLGSLEWSNSFDLICAINHYSATGYSADTVGFGLAQIVGNGLPDGFDDTALSITIGPMSTGQIGKTICIDSAYYPPSGLWLWAGPAGSDEPLWGGPYCWAIEDFVNTTDVTVDVSYANPVPGSAASSVLPHAMVELWDKNLPHGPDSVLDTKWTNANGRCEFDSIVNLDQYDSTRQDIFFRVYSINYFAIAYDDFPSHGGQEHYWESAVHIDIPNGAFTTSVTVPSNDAGPFFLADKVVKSYNAWNSAAVGDEIHKTVKIVLKADTLVSEYVERGSEKLIFINDSTDNVGMWSDAFNEPILHHEYGHWIHWDKHFLKDTSIMRHWMDSVTIPSLAAKEGWCHFWSAYIMNDARRVEYWRNFQDSAWDDFETGLFTRPNKPLRSFNAMGTNNEGACAGILWDIYDAVADDTSSLSDYGSLSYPHHSDGIGDQLSLGIDPILDVFLDGEVNSRGILTMEEFWQVWFDPYSKNLYQQEMSDLFYEHGDSTKMGCCYGIRGNIDGDASEEIVITDLVHLIDYMFLGGLQPACHAEANVNGDTTSVSDIADLVYLIDYMFDYGPAPASCP